jgi:hypothetical protein
MENGLYILTGKYGSKKTEFLISLLESNLSSCFVINQRDDGNHNSEYEKIKKLTNKPIFSEKNFSLNDVLEHEFIIVDNVDFNDDKLFSCIKNSWQSFKNDKVLILCVATEYEINNITQFYNEFKVNNIDTLVLDIQDLIVCNFSNVNNKLNQLSNNILKLPSFTLKSIKKHYPVKKYNYFNNKFGLLK